GLVPYTTLFRSAYVPTPVRDVTTSPPAVLYRPVGTVEDMAVQEVAPARAGRRQWFGFAVLMIPVLLVAIDNTALTFALPDISVSLAPSGVQLMWIEGECGRSEEHTSELQSRFDLV